MLGAGEAFRTFPFRGSVQLIRLSGTLNCTLSNHELIRFEIREKI